MRAADPQVGGGHRCDAAPQRPPLDEAPGRLHIGELRHLALERRPVVQLEHPNGAGRRGLDAQLAQNALVEVVLHHLGVPVLGLVDVDRTRLLELLGQLGVVARLVGQLDVDELARHQAAPPSLSLTRFGISAMSSATVMPTDSRRAIFSVAVSSLPSTIVPAWPKLIPGISSMNRPAMKATMGISRVARSWMCWASWASMRPPGSV